MKVDPRLVRAIDRVLEVSVVGSFSRLGIVARRALEPDAELPRQNGRRIVVTGATSGIGYAIADGLASLGASVEIVARSSERAEQSRSRLAAAHPDAEIGVSIADLADLDAVADLGRALAGSDHPPEAFVHCAGGLSPTFARAANGMEVTVVTQLLAPYVLTAHGLPALRRAQPGRVVFVSSGGMYAARLDLDRLDAPPVGYRGARVYAEVKRAQVVLVREWAGVEPSIVFSAMHPGWVDTPGLTSGLPGFARVLRPALRTPPEGADTAIFLAAGGGDGCSGAFFGDRRVRPDYRLPGTHERPAVADGLLAWCAAHAPAGTPEVR
jgi:NAD(P)-dependent dehydrogenase (short-subunit alcohol dehydrogenase family)